MSEGVVDRLSIEVDASTDSAVSKLNKLISTLKGVRASTTSISQSFQSVVNGIEEVSNRADSATAKVAKLAGVLKSLGEAKIADKLPASFSKISYLLKTISTKDIKKLQQISSALSGVSSVDLSVLKEAASAGVIGGANREDSNNSKASGSPTGIYKVFAGVRQALGDKNALRDAERYSTVLDRIRKSFGRVAFYRMVRSAIKLVTDALQEGTKNAYGFSAAFGDSSNGVRTIAEAYDQLASASFKLTNQLGAAWASLIRAVMPIILQFIDLVTRAANIVTQFFAAIAGSGTYLKAIDYNKKWGDSAKTAAKAAKEWKNQLMGFDEINRLEAPADPSGSVSGMETPDYGSMYEIAEVDSKIADIADKFNRVKELCKKHLDELKLVAYEGMLGIGLVLLLTGANIFLGIGMLAAGGIGLAKEIDPNWDAIKGKVGGSLGAIELAASGMLLGVGLALAMSGVNVPLGLGLMSLGALGIAGNFALNWDDMPDSIRRTIGKIELIVGGGMLAVGAALAFSGANIPVGIGLMALGASALGAGVATDRDEIVGIMQSKIGLIVEAISTGLLAIGAILVFSGANIPLGLGLMSVGALGMASVIAANWDTIRTAIENSLSSILLVLGTGSLVLGAILTLTGANIPLGIGLMAIGATALGAAVAINWEAITEAMSGTLGILTMIAGGALAALGVILLLTGNIPLGIGLLIAGIGIFGVAAANYDWDAMGKLIREKLTDIYNTVREKIAEIGENIRTGWETIKNNTQTKWNEIKEKISAKWSEIKADVIPKLAEVKQNVLQGWNELKNDTQTKWSEIKEKISTTWDNIKTTVASKAQAVTNDVRNKFNEKRNIVQSTMSTILGIISGSWGSIVSSVSGSLGSMFSNVSSTFQSIHATVSGWIERLKSLMKFEWKIPKPKLPKVKVSWEDTGLGNLKIPKFDVSWHARGGIIDGATLIGAGEAGKEAIIPLERNTEWIGKVAEDLNRMGNFDGSDTAEAVEESGDAIVTTLLSCTMQIIAAMQENSSEEGMDFDGFVRQVTKVQRRQARSAGLA